MRRNCFSAPKRPEPTQRSRWSPPCQRFTFEQTLSTIENADSMILVLAPATYAVAPECGVDVQSTFPLILPPNFAPRWDSGPSIRGVVGSAPVWRKRDLPSRKLRSTSWPPTASVHRSDDPAHCAACELDSAGSRPNRQRTFLPLC